jgi:hypothetical protein
MNHLLYNIAIVMLLIGTIILTSYITKAYHKPKCPKQNIIKQKTDILDDQFDARPTQIFDAMFTKPSLWQGYETLQILKNK